MSCTVLNLTFSRKTPVSPPASALCMRLDVLLIVEGDELASAMQSGFVEELYSGCHLCRRLCFDMRLRASLLCRKSSVALLVIVERSKHYDHTQLGKPAPQRNSGQRQSRQPDRLLP